MATALRLEQQSESGIAADVDAVDRVHLAGDAKGHGSEALLLISRSD
jgi:hypothetical protein